MAFCGPPQVVDTHIVDQQQHHRPRRAYSTNSPSHNQYYHANNTNNNSNSNSNNNSMMETHHFDRDRSAFGDNYSVKSRNSYSTSNNLPRYHDEPEADYDKGATELYSCIENKDWDAALSRLEVAPLEAKTWVSRREYDGTKTRWRLLPLHALCIFRAPLALIEAMIEVYQDGPQMKDDQGMLPVHLACRNGASKGVVLTLLRAFPEALRVCDRKGRSPIDLVEATNSANKEAVLLAVKKFQKEWASNSNPAAANQPPPPQQQQQQQQGGYFGGMFGGATAAGYSDYTPPGMMQQQQHNSPLTPHAPQQQQTPNNNVVAEVDYENRTILFRLILKKDWKNVSSRAAAYPEEASTWIVTKGFNGNLRFLPLHKACVLQPPESSVKALLASYPDAASATDQDGWMPVHCACFYGANSKVVDILVTAHPKGAQSKDDEGRLPLHYACLKGASKAVVDVLLASFAKGAMVKDDEGRLPIHHACSKSAPENIIEALLKASPKGAQSKDDQGRLALHHACRKNASERVIRTLLRVYPRAAQIKDDQDKLPVHYACHAAAGTAVVSLLLQTYPESVNVQNGFGFTPLVEAKSLNNPKMEGVIKILEKVKKEQDKNKVKTGEAAEMESKVDVLEERLAHLEKMFGKVTVLGKEMKNDIKRRKDPTVILDKFSEALIELGNRSKQVSAAAANKHKDGNGGSGGAPLKSRQTTSGSTSTPSKGLFGRSRASKHGVKSK